MSAKKRREPNTTTDANGNVTNYTYDPTHGGVLTVKAPAPTTGGVRPETRYSYSTPQAYFARAPGASIVASGQPVVELTGTSTCQTTASCTGTADEIVATASHGTQTAGLGNNLLPVSVSKGAGYGSLTATNAFGYDAVGNRISVDGPLAGTADTTTYRYDADREQVGVVSPDPDGGGPYTLIATARLNDVDPQAWLADALNRIADIPQQRLHELLPWNWARPQRALKAA